MNNSGAEKHLEDLANIRSMMERSSRFISLSGLSGVFAGTYALLGAAAAWFWLIPEGWSSQHSQPIDRLDFNYLTFFFLDAAGVLIASLLTAAFLTARKARRNGQSIWDKVALRMVINLALPLMTGGVFCLILLHHGIVFLIAPCTLIFYGLGLLNASKYTLNDIRYLGVSEIGLGLLASLMPGYGLLFWALGFGVLHIIYGVMMYQKYDR